MTQSTELPSPTSDRTQALLRRALQLLAAILIYALILFLFAGRLDWPAAWYYLVLQLVLVSLGGAVILRRNPEVVVARSKIRSDIETWDKWISLLVTLGMFATLAVPGLDLRFRWSVGFPLVPQVLGFVAVTCGYALLVWAMLNNPFFEAGVRIQADRGHGVATAGPYRIVRHPGYVGMILQQLGTPLALASWWGLIPGIAASLIFVVRTSLEDRTLQSKLPGYADFAQHTRFRLIPGLW